MAVSDYLPLLGEAARLTGLPVELLVAQCRQESAGDPNSVSSCGALGLMQLMPQSFPNHTREQLLDPATNIRIGSEFLREMVGLFPTAARDEALRLGLACYNCGPGYVLAAVRLAAEAQPTWAGALAQLPNAVVRGKRADIAQVSEYVRIIWTNYELAVGEARGAGAGAGGSQSAA